jgi:hypothetical protein
MSTSVAAPAIALGSAAIASGGGLGGRGALGYFVGTAAVTGVALAIAVATIWEVCCGGAEIDAGGGC